ncbi:uncharacterized protein CcaverHIS019_0202000 [Cutaneotrichosporon cavernicola]|uniref:Major facilitator superfamily (MFS) profile domain-containing protein n=1 Tax=Cutaneotrichosporon cavernicola TaxID=279322 RepID=A0AA48L2H2_9TREE|nr:uncharacterized protein CcaverHIS019_0202000 [Cutaneotrichosporon cavernicola]BEI88838.1 hypothetical protein CcaverHIS019_0202000 [Cutaneotrichosporon cavernicola]BEI96613.1 hypothetical protein CcaverHIS631_0202020 [Cutaneotrichosporon cavernicola]
MGMFSKSSSDDVAHEMKGDANPPTLDPQEARIVEKSREEKRFLLKLDIFLLTYGCFSQVIKYLDQTNITTAYVSGMSEDLGFVGNELNLFTTYFNVGYCIFLIPSQVFITYFRPSWWLPGLEFIWGVFTGCIAACKTAEPIYALRALIGLAESSAYPGTVTMLMAWYTPLEMAKRIGFYHSCQAVGGMLSGALQTAIQETMADAHGIRGWQWTFIINCIMTIGMALIGPFLIPDFPDKPNPRAFWLTKRDYEIARMRLDRFRRVDVKPIKPATFKRTFSSPQLYLAMYLYVGMLIAVSGIDYFQLWLKSLVNPDGSKVWGITQLNAIPMGGRAMQIVGVWIAAYCSDVFRTRWAVLLAICVVGIPSCIIMTVWNVPNSAKYYAYFILYMLQSHGPPLWAWLSDMLPTHAEQRALTLGVCITAYYAINAWSNILIFPTKQAPHYRYGWPVCLALYITSGLVIVALHIYDIKVIR